MNSKSMFRFAPLDRVFWPLVLGIAVPAILLTISVFRPDWVATASFAMSVAFLACGRWFLIAREQEMRAQNVKFPHNEDYVVVHASLPAGLAVGLALFTAFIKMLEYGPNMAPLPSETVSILIGTLFVAYALYLSSGYILVFGYNNAAKRFLRKVSEAALQHPFAPIFKANEKVFVRVTTTTHLFLWAMTGQRRQIVEWAVVKMYDRLKKETDSTLLVICSNSYRPGDLITLGDIVYDLDYLPHAIASASTSVASYRKFCWYLLEEIAKAQIKS